MGFEEFLEKQESVYEKFRDTSAIEKEGLSPRIPKQQGGYLIAFRHPNKITDALGEFSHSVSRIVPAIVYDGKNAHTTVSDFQVQDDFSPDADTLKKLTDLVHTNKPLSKEVIINYNGWLLNQNTGIAAGKPNQPFYDVAERIINYAQQNGIQLRLPWGAHITTNRFLENKPPEKIQELMNAFRAEKPLGESKPEYVDVGSFILTSHIFNYNVHERFNF